MNIDDLLYYIKEELGLSSQLTEGDSENYYFLPTEGNALRLHYDIDTRVVYPLIQGSGRELGESGYFPISNDELEHILKGEIK